MSLKTDALSGLKTKFEGIDEKVLSRIASKIAKTAKNEDEVNAAVDEMTIQGVIDAYTDSRVSEGTEKAVKTYEEKHGLKDGKKVESEDPGKKEEDPGKKEEKKEEMPAWAKAMMDELSTLKAEKTANKRQSTFESMIKDAPEKMKVQLTREFKRATFKDDDDFDSWMDEIKPDVEEAVKSGNAHIKTTTPPKAGGGVQTGTIDANVQARIDARNAETVAPAIKGLPTNS